MAFDKNDPADLAALKSEEADDPIGMDYAGAGTNDRKILALFNEADKNVQDPVPTTGVTLTVEVLFDEMVAEEFGGNQVDQGEMMWITAILNFLPVEPDKDIEKWKAKIIALLPNNSLTEENIDALLRDMSRAEVLFGVDTFITQNDWVAARDS